MIYQVKVHTLYLIRGFADIFDGIICLLTLSLVRPYTSIRLSEKILLMQVMESKRKRLEKTSHAK